MPGRVRIVVQLWILLHIAAMPAAAIYNKDWIGEGGMEMTANALRNANAQLGKGVDIRIRSMIAGVTRFARVSQGKEDHGRAGTDGLILSATVSKTVTEGEWLLNPLIKLVHLHGEIFDSRSGMVRDSLPTVLALFLIDSQGDRNDLMLPHSDDGRAGIAHPLAQTSLAVEIEAVSSFTSPFNWTYISKYWRNWSEWIYGRIEDSRHAQISVLLGKGWTLALANPALPIPMVLFSAAWIVRAFNITFSSVLNVTLDSDGVMIRWIVIVIGDFLEGSPVARLLVGIALLYLSLVALIGCFYCVGSLIASMVYRWWSALKRASQWCCRSRSKPVVPATHPEIIPTPAEPVPQSQEPQMTTLGVEKITVPHLDREEAHKVSPAGIPTIELVDFKTTPNEVDVAPLPVQEESPMILKPKDACPSVDSWSGHDRVCQAHLIALVGSDNRLSESPRNGKRLKLCNLLSMDDLYQGGKRVVCEHVK